MMHTIYALLHFTHIYITLTFVWMWPLIFNKGPCVPKGKEDGSWLAGNKFGSILYLS